MKFFVLLLCVCSVFLYAEENSSKALTLKSINKDIQEIRNTKKLIPTIENITKQSKSPKTASFYYLNFEALYGIPSFLGFGYRKIFEKKALDVFVSVSPILILGKHSDIPMNASVSFLKYKKIKNHSQRYSGMGGNLNTIFNRHTPFTTLSFQYMIGKEFFKKKNKSFLQAKVNWPNVPILFEKGFNPMIYTAIFFTPVINLSYGYGF